MIVGFSHGVLTKIPNGGSKRIELFPCLLSILMMILISDANVVVEAMYGKLRLGVFVFRLIVYADGVLLIDVSAKTV